MGKVVIAGGGAAGMMAAISAAEEGNQVVLLEQNEKLGKKLFITGKGRCNITNDSDVENLVGHVVQNPRFLYSAFYQFDSWRMMEFLQKEGLRIKTERGNRVFPVSDHSSDVIGTLEKAMRRRSVDVRLHTRVEQVLQKDGKCTGVICRKAGEGEYRLAADAVIIATGGASYPSTGSTGDGYRFAEELGLKVSPVYPSLVPFEIKEGFCKELQGLSLKNISLKLIQGKNVLYEEQGEMLFTHFGISGPLVLAASAYAAGASRDMKVILDLKPALSEKKLDDRLLRDLEKYRNSHFRNSLKDLLPSKMIPVVIHLSGIAPDKPVNAVTREERRGLGTLLKGLELTVKKSRGFAEAVITRGGVSVKEVDPGTMESKKVSGLYFAGEVLDVDALTGGYNLQIAWSTGHLAGCSIRKKED